MWGGGVRGVGRRAGWERRGRAPPGIRAPPPPAAPTVLLPELRSLLAAGRARLVDVRSREEAAAGTIPGALNIPGTGLGGGARHVVDPGVLAEGPHVGWCGGALPSLSPQASWGEADWRRAWQHSRPWCLRGDRRRGGAAPILSADSRGCVTEPRLSALLKKRRQVTGGLADSQRGLRPIREVGVGGRHVALGAPRDLFDHQDPVLPGKTSEPETAKLRLSVLSSDSSSQRLSWKVPCRWSPLLSRLCTPLRSRSWKMTISFSSVR